MQMSTKELEAKMDNMKVVIFDEDPNDIDDEDFDDEGGVAQEKNPESYFDTDAAQHYKRESFQDIR